VTAGTAPLLHTSAPGVVLARSTHTEASPSGIGAVATALGILQGVFTPLSVQVDLDRIDELGLPTGDLDDPIRSLHAPRPPGLRPVDLAGAHATAVSAIVPATLAEWLRAACFEPDVGWVHLRTTAAKAYTADTPPSTLRNLEGKPFATVQGTDDDGSFVAGPRAGEFRRPATGRRGEPRRVPPGAPSSRGLASLVRALQSGSAHPRRPHPAAGRRRLVPGACLGGVRRAAPGLSAQAA
jgi:hypothetical protein